MRIVIGGAGGLIGSALVPHLERAGHVVVRLVRREPAATEVRWDPAAGRLDPAALRGADAVICLNGTGIGDRRWTAKRKAEILASRVDSTSLLAETMAAMPEPPEVFLAGSAIGIYGDRGDEILTETSAPGAPGDFLVDVTRQWEAAAQPAADAGIRTVFLRTGIVLDSGEGALAKMLLPFKLGVGGKLGSGEQWWSHIALEDEVRAVAHLLGSQLSGPVNLTAPHPVTNREFTKVLGEVLHRPTLMTVPRAALGVALGAELAQALAFTSARVLPSRLLGDGFTFRYPQLRAGLEAAVSPGYTARIPA